MLKKTFSIFILFLSLVYLPNITKAYDGCETNNSCINGDDLGTTLKKYAVTLGIYGFIDNYFSMCDSEAEGASVTLDDGTTGINCQIPSDKVKFKYKSLTTDVIKEVGDGQEVTVDSGFVTFRGLKQNDKICVQVWLPITGYINMGCKYMNPPNNSYTIEACYAGASCNDISSSYSQVPIPITSRVVQCVKETIYTIFTCDSACGTGDQKTNPFVNVQNGLRTAVKLALTLYVIFFGIKIALGQDLPKKGEVFIFLMKAILVMYFSVGIYNPSNTQNSVPNCPSNVGYEDGITKYMLPGFMNLGSALSNIVIKAGSANGFCNYDPSSYKTGFEYLSLWDALDCRVGYYFGIYNPSQGATAATVAIVAIVAPFFLTLIMAVLFSAQIFMAIIVLIFAIFLLSFIVFFVNIYIVALIAVAILIYFAPLFVPMALFRQTKGYFDSWLRLTFGYAIQPVVIVAFIALLFTIFDQMFYEGCKFTTTTISDNDKPYFVIDEDSGHYDTSSGVNFDTCKESVGYKIGKMMSKGGDLFTEKSFLFFEYNTFKDPGPISQLAPKFVSLLLFLFLFYHFANILAQFAADLTSSTSLGEMAQNPNAITNKAGELAKRLYDYKRKGKEQGKGNGNDDDPDGKKGIDVKGGNNDASRKGIDVKGSNNNP
ncbi:MAG: type IV secretion system protein [Alphaproteobacteria bacterium]